jgi:hypothetical protein
LGETPRETVLDDQGASKPLSVRLDVLLNPLFASGSERAEQENCALIANQNVGGIRDKSRRTTHGCVLLWSNTHQVTKTEKAPWYQALSWRPFALCATSAFRLTTVRLQTSVGRAFRAVLMLTGFYLHQR